MSKPDLDALEKLLVTEAADPFAFVEAAPALLAMARRTEELERQVTAATSAIGAVLDRIQSDPDVRYLLGPGSDVFRRLVNAEAAITGDDPEAVEATRVVARPPVSEPEVLRLRRLVGEREARAAEAERERGEARAKVEEASGLCGDLLESLRVASKTSDGYRDAHAAYQRWAAKLAPDAIGDEQKRAAIDARLARPPLDPAHVAVLRGMLDEEREKSVTAMHAEMRNHYAQRAAAIEAALGEEVRP